MTAADFMHAGGNDPVRVHGLTSHLVQVQLHIHKMADVMNGTRMQAHDSWPDYLFTPNHMQQNLLHLTACHLCEGMFSAGFSTANDPTLDCDNIGLPSRTFVCLDGGKGECSKHIVFCCKLLMSRARDVSKAAKTAVEHELLSRTHQVLDDLWPSFGLMFQLFGTQAAVFTTLLRLFTTNINQTACVIMSAQSSPMCSTGCNACDSTVDSWLKLSCYAATYTASKVSNVIVVKGMHSYTIHLQVPVEQCMTEALGTRSPHWTVSLASCHNSSGK